MLLEIWNFFLLFFTLITIQMVSQNIETYEKSPVFPECDSLAIATLKACFNNKINQHIYKTFKVPQIVNDESYKGDVQVLFEVDKEGAISVLYVDAVYDELKEDVDFLDEFSRHGNVKRADFAGRLAINENGDVVYNFGKQKDKTVKEVMINEPGYYGWMMSADFPLYTKQCLKAEMDRIKAENSQNEVKGFDNKLDALKNKFKK